MHILACDNFRAGSVVSWSVHIYEVISRLSEMGHDIALLSGDYVRNKVGKEDNPVESLWRRMEKRLVQWRVFQPFRGELHLLGILRHEVYVFFSVLIILLRQKGSFDVIYRRHNLLNSEYFLAKLFRIALVKEVNGITADEAKITNWGDRVSLWVIDQIERFNMPKADKIIVVTPKLKELLQTDHGVPQDRIVVIANGANTELFRPMDVIKARAELGLSQTDNYVCFVGNLIQWQGIEYLIKSAPSIRERVPEVQFVIVGDGGQKSELEELARHIGVLDRFTFTGVVPYQKVPLYINASDVCVAPFIRERNERTGVSALKIGEYLACSRPVAASRLAGLEFIEDYNAGVLVTPEDPQEFADAITKLLQYPELRKQMGENGRTYISQNLSWESVAKRVAEVLSDAMDAGSKDR